MELAGFKEIDNYIRHREKPTDFMVAILSNDLYGTCFLQWTYGDWFTLSHLKIILDYIYKNVPSEARGTLFKVESWLDKK